MKTIQNDLKIQLEKNAELKGLLKEAMYALCSYRVTNGKCANCPDAFYCKAKTLIPKIEAILKKK